jgi:hypothetical protein
VETEGRPVSRLDVRRLLGVAMLVLGVIVLAGRLSTAPRIVREVVRVEPPAAPIPPDPPAVPAMPEMPDMPNMPEMPAMPDIPSPPEPPDVRTIEVNVSPRAPWSVFALGRALAAAFLGMAILVMGVILVMRQINRPSAPAPASGPEADHGPSV